MDDIDYQLTRLLHYRSLHNIEQAATILATALMQQQRILVVGDFDSDGATSSALAVSALRSFGARHVDYLVPNRFDYGYGLTPEIVAVALSQKQPDLLITVDNGISSHDGVVTATQAGLQVIITDHHLPGTSLPAADAIINPQLADDHFPSKHLAGVGVIFYVMLALRQALRDRQWFQEGTRPEPNMLQFLDLVALGTVADSVVLDHNNRLMVYQGLQWIRTGKARPGIYALIKLAKRELRQLVSSDLAYSVAPRLNAAGRLADMSLGVACLLAEDTHTAHEAAVQLSQLNEERKATEATMRSEAFTTLNQLLTQESLPKGICLFDTRWHQGVIGLLAARIVDRYYRPSIVFAPSGRHGSEIKGSARSIPGISIRDVLAIIAVREPQLIVKFGGHAMAAGLTLQREAFLPFSKLFQEVLEEYVNDELLQAKPFTDGELQAEDFCLSLAETLRYQAGPWGQGFPEPIFEGSFTVLSQRLVGNRHLKMIVDPVRSGQQFEAIAFNVDTDYWPNHRIDQVRASYRLSINDYQGRKRVQLVMETLLPRAF